MKTQTATHIRPTYCPPREAMSEEGAMQKSMRELAAMFPNKERVTFYDIPSHSHIKVGENVEMSILRIHHDTSGYIETMRKSTLDIYKGNLEGGQRNGYGEMFFTCGDIYKGFWEDDEFHGRGEFVEGKTGNKFVGDFKYGLPHGEGSKIFNDGGHRSCYEGEWKKGQRHGKGRMTYSDGGWYYGDWVEDKKHGKGAETIFKNALGCKKITYTGPYVEGKWEGENARLAYDGGKFPGYYYGAMRAGLKNGYGVEVHPKSNNKYSGEWENDHYHGKGLMEYALRRGDVVRGYYDGGWVQGKKNGYGVELYAKTGDKYTGNFTKDKRNGKGKIVYANGGYYDGGWRNGKKHGEGIECDEHGKKIATGYLFGIPLGPGTQV